MKKLAGIIATLLILGCAGSPPSPMESRHPAAEVQSDFTAALDGLEKIPGMPVPPAPYMFWGERVDRLLAMNAEAKKVVEEAGLSRDQCIAIFAYSDTLYGPINRGLWSQEELPAPLKVVDGVLRAGLQRLPLFAGKTYRIVGYGGSVDREKFLRENAPGANVLYLGYTSTSRREDWLSDPGGNREFGVHLVLQSRTGRWIGPLTASALLGKSQDEVLFPRGTTFQVIKADTSGKIPRIELIEAEQR